jgi:gliding motility-associated-like protein
MPTISFFNFLNASAQCTNLDIVASKTDACAPEVIIYYVINAPDGSLFEWEIAGNKFFGGDTIYQSQLDPASFMPIFGDSKISVPWAFTPNGDGLNDGFSPQTKYFNDGTIIGDYIFSIYNRWSEKIYETTLRSDSWDGTYQGEICQQGVYVYQIKAKSLVGKIFNEKGTVTLLR